MKKILFCFLCCFFSTITSFCYSYSYSYTLGEINGVYYDGNFVKYGPSQFEGTSGAQRLFLYPETKPSTDQNLYFCQFETYTSVELNNTNHRIVYPDNKKIIAELRIPVWFKTGDRIYVFATSTKLSQNTFKDDNFADKYSISFVDVSTDYDKKIACRRSSGCTYENTVQYNICGFVCDNNTPDYVNGYYKIGHTRNIKLKFSLNRKNCSNKYLTFKIVSSDGNHIAYLQAGTCIPYYVDTISSCSLDFHDNSNLIPIQLDKNNKKYYYLFCPLSNNKSDYYGMNDLIFDVSLNHNYYNFNNKDIEITYTVYTQSGSSIPINYTKTIAATLSDPENGTYIQRAKNLNFGKSFAEHMYSFQYYDVVYTHGIYLDIKIKNYLTDDPVSYTIYFVPISLSDLNFTKSNYKKETNTVIDCNQICSNTNNDLIFTYNNLYFVDIDNESLRLLNLSLSLDQINWSFNTGNRISSTTSVNISPNSSASISCSGNKIYYSIKKNNSILLQFDYTSSISKTIPYKSFTRGTISDAVQNYGVNGTMINGTPSTGDASSYTTYKWYYTTNHELLSNLNSNSGWNEWVNSSTGSTTLNCKTHTYFKRIETNVCGASTGVFSVNSSDAARYYSVLKTKISASISNSNQDKWLQYNSNNTVLSVNNVVGGAGSNYSYSWRRKPKNGSWENLNYSTSSITLNNLTSSYTYECTIHDPYYDNDCKRVVSTDINVYPELNPGRSYSSLSNINIDYGASYILKGVQGSGGSSDLSYYWKKRKANSQDNYESFNGNSGINITVIPEINTEYCLFTKDNITGQELSSTNSFIVYVNLYPGKILTSNQLLDTTICFGGNVSIVSSDNPKGGSGNYYINWCYSINDGQSFDSFIPQVWGNLTVDGISLGTLNNIQQTILIYRIIRDKSNTNLYACSDTILISVLPKFTVDSPNDDTICYGTKPDTLLVKANGGTGNYSYKWYFKDIANISQSNILLSETDSLYDWSTLKYGVPEQMGVSSYYVEVSDNCATPFGAGSISSSFNIYMLGNIFLNSPAFYSTIEESGSGNFVLEHDLGVDKIVYAKIPNNKMPVGGSGNFVYRWYGKNINDVWNNGFDNSDLTFLQINCGSLVDTMLYKYSITDLTCKNHIYYSDSIQLNIVSFNKPVLNNNQVQQICYNSIPEAIRMTTRPGVVKYFYTWFKSVDGGKTYSELLGYVGDTLVFADVANNRLISDALFKVRVQLGTGSNARYLESDPITVQVVSQVNPGQITIGNGGNGSIVDNDTVIYNMTSPLLRNLQSADGGHINASSVSYQWYKKEGAQTIFSPIDGATNADYQPGQVKLTTSYYRAVNDVCASSYSNIVTVNVKNVSISENIGGNNGGNSENGDGNNNGGNNGNQGGNNGNNGGNNNGGESNNGTQNYDNSLDLTPDLDYLGDDFVYQGGGIWEKTSSNNPLKKARYCRGSNVNLNLNVDIVGTYIWLDDSDNEIKKGSKFNISNIQNDTIVKAQIYDTEGVLVLEQLYVITVVDAYPEFKASKVHVEAGESVRFTNSTKDLKSALWSFGDGTDVSFADEPWHYFVKPGTFTVTLTAVSKLGCKATLTKNEYIIVDKYSGAEYTDVNDNKSFDVQVFPNPAKDILYVRGEKDLSIKMFSSQGAILFSADGSNDFDIDMSNLSEGVYMLKISDGSWTISRKVIKQ